MKKLSTFITIVIFALAMILTSCSKDSTSSSNNGGGGGGTVVGTHLTRITDISSQYSNDNVLYSTDIVEHRFRWTGNLVTQWDCYYNGELSTRATISYNNSGKMIRANVINDTNGQNIILTFNYTGQNITNINYTYIDNNAHETATVTYNAGKMSSFSYLNILFFNNLSWNGDDISSCETVGGSEIYVYDTELNPLDKQIAFLMVCLDLTFKGVSNCAFFSKHNVKHKQWESNYGENNSTDYTYTYDSTNTYPVSRTYSKEYSWGYESGETDYEYED